MPEAEKVLQLARRHVTDGSRLVNEQSGELARRILMASR
jgi:hypothetical protein